MVISDNEIHVWIFSDKNLANFSPLFQHYNLLTEEETLKVNRFKFEKHKHQYLMTRVMLKSVLSRYVDNIQPEEWQFNINEYGKPYIGNSTLTMPLKFNLSHTEGMIVLAISLHQEVGVDVEYSPRLNGILDIAKGFFSALEVEQLLELPPEKQKDRFFDLWTLKEAYVKARGMGLAIPFNSFSYSFTEENIKLIFHKDIDQQSEPWQFWQIIPSDKHKIALVTNNHNINGAHSISMRNFISLSTSIEINYPIAHACLVAN